MIPTIYYNVLRPILLIPATTNSSSSNSNSIIINNKVHMSTINCKQYPKVFIYIYHILYFCIPLLYPRAATSSAKNCPSDLTSKGYLRLLGSASTQSGFTGLFLTYPASALSPRPTCLADPMLPDASSVLLPPPPLLPRGAPPLPPYWPLYTP